MAEPVFQAPIYSTNDLANAFWRLLSGGSISDSSGGTLAPHVYGTLAETSATLTRPSDTTAYTALDAIANATGTASLITFSNAARYNGGGGYITKARLRTNQQTNTAQYRLYLYNTTGVVVQSDNVPFGDFWSDNSFGESYISFSALSQEATGATGSAARVVLTPGNGNIPLAFICGANDKNLYGRLVAVDAFTPASAQQFYIELTVEQY